MRSIRFLVAAVLAAAPLVAQVQPKPGVSPSIAAKTSIYDYTATIASTARIQGSVVAAGINWNCQGALCKTSGPWPTPGVGACAALAKMVGTITAYGHSAKQLAAADLQTCNQGGSAPVNVPVTKPLTARTLGIAKPVAAPPSVPPGTPPASSGTSRSGPVSLRTAAFQVTGTGALAASLPFNPKNVRTATFQVTGTGTTAFGTAFTPKIVRTPPMTVTGTGSN